jgi:hypothetical protein
MIPPNIARPTMNIVAVATVKTRLRKRYGGRTGSATRRSTATNTLRSTAPTTASVMMVGELQAYWVPPQVTASSTDPTPPTRSAVPR